MIVRKAIRILDTKAKEFTSDLVFGKTVSVKVRILTIWPNSWYRQYRLENTE